MTTSTAAAPAAKRAALAAGDPDLARHTRDAIPRLTDALDTYLELEARADARRVSRLLKDHGIELARVAIHNDTAPMAAQSRAA